MKRIEKILQQIEYQGIDIAEFERLSNISNGYLKNTLSRGADISQKILDKIEKASPMMYKIVEDALNMSAIDNNSNKEVVNSVDYRAKYEKLMQEYKELLEKHLDLVEQVNSGKHDDERSEVASVAIEAALVHSAQDFSVLLNEAVDKIVSAVKTGK